MKKAEDNSKNKRRTWLIAGLALLGGGLISRIWTPSEPESEGEKVKMLTPDGKLVLVDKSKIKSSETAHKASNEELRTWMNTREK